MNYLISNKVNQKHVTINIVFVIKDDLVIIVIKLELKHSKVIMVSIMVISISIIVTEQKILELVFGEQLQQKPIIIITVVNYLELVIIEITVIKVVVLNIFIIFHSKHFIIRKLVTNNTLVIIVFD